MIDTPLKPSIPTPEKPTAIPAPGQPSIPPTQPATSTDPAKPSEPEQREDEKRIERFPER
jgi:hypothetical protein